MATQYPKIEDTHRAFVEEQHMFFVATAAPDGRVNLSPKGQDSLRILSPERLIWLNLTGSGNETRRASAGTSAYDIDVVFFLTQADDLSHLWHGPRNSYG